MENKNVNIAMKVSRNTIIGNVLLFAFKLVGGIIGHSAAMLSDAVHTLSDVLSTFIVIIGVKVASKKPDKEHLYGHERFESVAAIILAIILLATGIGIGYGGIHSIVTALYKTLPLPNWLALTALMHSHPSAALSVYWELASVSLSWTPLHAL